MVKSRLLFFIVGVSAVFFFLHYYDKQFGFTVIYALLLMLIYSAVIVFLSPVALRIRERVERDTIFKGEQIVYSFEIINRGVFFYPRIEYMFHNSDIICYGQQKHVLQIGPRRIAKGKCSAAMPYRGVYMLGVDKVMVTDFLGLFRFELKNKDSLFITVLPKPDQSYQYQVLEKSQQSVMRSDPFNEDHTSVSELRKYIPSDSLNKIHWKLTAKRGELIVKNYASLTRERSVILLDTLAIPLENPQKAQFEDAIISGALSVIENYYASRISAEIYDGHNTWLLNDGMDIDAIYLKLARIDFSGEISSLHTFIEQYHALEDIGYITVFLSDITEEINRALAYLSEANCRISLYLYSCPKLPVSEQTRLRLQMLEASGAFVREIEVLASGNTIDQ